MSKDERFDLEERLIDFAVRIIKLSDSLPKTDVGHHIRKQVLRSGTSPAPNYGEAQSAESRNDFIHKMKLALKELRETKIWLRMIIQADLLPSTRLEPLLQENEELISIFVTSIQTAQKNKEK
ncbi:MAG: four helix bundle protein [Planctomycetia bacterium]|jgi:four helix bundle protein